MYFILTRPRFTVKRDQPEGKVKDMEEKRLERDKPDENMKDLEGKEVRVR